jgi:hypothetical protein
VAPVLLCPECGTKHPLDNVAANAAFPCSGCGRTLKVPAQAREMSAAAAASDTGPVAASPPPPPSPVPAPHPTQVLSAVPPETVAPVAAAVPLAAVSTAPPLGPPQGIASTDLARGRPAAATAPSAPVPPVWVRFLLWLVAVPLAFFVVFGFARAVGFLSTNDVQDLALTDGWRRYWPIVRLLPFVAIVTAVFVTAGVYGLGRMRAQQRAKASTPSSRSGSNGPKSRPPRQSSRAGA